MFAKHYLLNRCGNVRREQRKERVLHKSVRNNFRRQDNVDIVVGQILGIVTVIHRNEMNKYKWS